MLSLNRNVVKGFLGTILFALLMHSKGITAPGIFPVTAGGNIQTAVNSASANAGGGIVALSAGSYSGTQITTPCTGNTVLITGPTTQYPVVNSANPAATISDSGAQSVFVFPTCNTARQISYVATNGNQPSGGGGGAVYLNESANNVTLDHNFFYGNWANVSTSHQYDALIWLNSNNNVNGTNTVNFSATYNKLGFVGSNDCSAVFNLYNYQGGDYGSAGGYCTGIGVHVGTTSFYFAYNVISQQEQGSKFFICGSSCSFQNSKFQYVYNTVQYFHRIGVESQNSTDPANPPHFDNNVIMWPVNPQYGMWGFSLPNGGNFATIENNNTMLVNQIQGTCPSACYSTPGAFEYWAQNGQSNNNFIQGAWEGGVVWGFGIPPWDASNNICQLNFAFVGKINGSPFTLTPANCVTSEGEQPSNGPSQNNNSAVASTSSTTVQQRPSIAPTLQPNQSFSGSFLVSMSDAGYTTNSGPQGNHTIYYTTDGSNPVPRSGTTKPYTGTFTITNTTTIKAVGIWGAITQPVTWPTGPVPGNYGWSPSAVQTATYTSSGGTPVAALPTFSPTAPSTFTTSLGVVASTSTAGGVLHCTIDGTTPTSGSPTTSSFTFTSTTTLQCITIASGYLNSGVASGTYTLSSPSPETLTSCFQGNNGNVNTLVVGQQIQHSLLCAYTTPTAQNLTCSPGPDTNGSSVTAWTSTDASKLTIGAVGSAHPGLVTAIAPTSGTVSTNSAASQPSTSTSLSCASWGWTVVAKALVSITVTTTGGVSTLVVPATNQLIVTGLYNDASTANITGSATFMTSDGSKATVSSGGLVTAVAAGNPTITATVSGVTPATLPLTITSGATSTYQLYINGKMVGSGQINPFN